MHLKRLKFACSSAAERTTLILTVAVTYIIKIGLQCKKNAKK